MGLKVYIDGQLFEKEDAKISVFDHAFLYGDGVFEGIRSYAGKLFELDEHINRLWESARTIMLVIPMTKSQMKDAVRDTLAANNLPDAYIRLVVTRGVGTLGLDPDACSNPSVVIITDRVALYPEEYYRNGLEIVTVPTIRNHPQALDPRMKSLNYLNNIMAKIEGKQAGAPEAIMLNHAGFVAECTGDNIFTVRDREIFTPSIASNILKGVTRQVVIDIAQQELNLPVHEVMMTRYDLWNAQECFLTGTAAEVIPVVRIDRRPIGEGKPGPITLELLRRFRVHTLSDTPTARLSQPGS